MGTLRTIAELIGAISVIIGACIAIEKWSKGKISAWLLKPILDKIDSLITKVGKIELDQLKLIIMSSEIPLEERLIAGETYLAKGGNGAIKVQVNVLQEKYKESLGGEKNVD